MFLAKVVGTVVCTVKHSAYLHEKILVTRRINLDGTLMEKDLLALDKAQAGVGDTVLVLNEGSSARTVLNNDTAPARAIIMGVVDQY
jgi:microcompartment protein CcmK/EutM